ncbi:hypothetical protein BST61_g7911 [Cercospora zeina]
MSAQRVHPVILLVEEMRQRPMDPEGRIPALRKKIRDLRADGYGNAGNALIGRRDLVGGNYIHDKQLRAKQKVVYWQIDRTFECMVKHHDNSIAELYTEIDAIYAKHQRKPARVEELEPKIERDGIQAITVLVRSPALHSGDSIQKKPTGFLDLPAELRNSIYKLSGCLELSGCHGWCYPTATGICTALDVQSGAQVMDDFSKMTINLSRGPGGFHWDVDATSLEGNYLGAVNHQPLLTRASKQIRAETLPIYYGSLRIEFDWHAAHQADSGMFRWLRRIGKENAALLNDVEVTIVDGWSSEDEREEPKSFEQREKRCVDVLGEMDIVTERCKFVWKGAPFDDW